MDFLETANEFKILGQERDGTILASFISKSPSSDVEFSMVGCYNPKEKSFEILKRFESRVNLVQASVNKSKNLLIFVMKDQIITDNCETDESDKKFAYKPFLVEINRADELHNLLEVESRTKQVMVQFLWPKHSKHPSQDKFLVMVHEEAIHLHTVTQKVDEAQYQIDKSTKKIETIVKNFVWSQWDSRLQSLFYIHLKQSTRISLEREEDDKVVITTLSAFQFHDDLPTETVLNIPLNLPKIPSSSKTSEYEDDTIPLRIHDSALNLVIVADEDKGMLFICHYYLYKPMKQPDEYSSNEVHEARTDVHFAYSITMVHCSVAVHCVIPGNIPWEKAKLMKPTFFLVDDYLLVYQTGIFINLVDIGLHHEPCAHIAAQPFTRQNNVTHLVPCFGSIAFDSATLDLISLQMPKSHLIDTFRSDKSLDNRLSIIHYFLAHKNDLDIFTELLNIIMESPLNLDTVSLLKEALVAGTYSTLKKGLSQEALSLIKLLPLTTSNTAKPLQAKVGELTVGLSHENLHNTVMMLLSPQQRLNPYRQDTWTRLYERLNDNKDCKKRFSCDQVSEKLVYSLACYQPEALSRCSTPQTPSGSTQMIMGDINQISSSSAARRNSNDVLPFIEFETCTASKQEHVISVNLRELSMHLVKNSVKQSTGFRWLKDYEPTAPTFVHAVSTRYVSAQLEVSRLLCVFLCRAAGIDARLEPDRGSTLIDKLSFAQRLFLFLTLERYVLAVQSMSFPLPQGFSSFFTYLGYKVLSYEKFFEYSTRFVFELQIDVMKVIMNGKSGRFFYPFRFTKCIYSYFADISDDEQGIARKLSLLSLLPRSRARRLLKNWDHPASLRIRGNDHAFNVLSGNSAGRSMSLSSSSHSSSLGEH